MAQENTELFAQPSEEKKPFKDRLKLTMSGLSGAFMLPISTLAIVAIFLSLGGLLESSFQPGYPLQKIGTLIKNVAYPLLQAIPLLFCVAFAYSFCKGDVSCIWSVILAYLVFLSVQSVFVYVDPVNSTNTDLSSQIQGYIVLFKGWGRDPKSMVNLVDNTLGFTALNTSIFGSLLLGGVMMPYIQRHYSNVQLKGPFAFFSGKRFLPLMAVIGAWGLALLFLIIWPWVGSAFSWLGNQLSKTPAGIDSFIFGVLEKCLIPTGLHHMFYSPLWFSPVGGDAVRAINELNGANAANISSGNAWTTEQLTYYISALDRYKTPVSAGGVMRNIWSGARVPHSMWQGDSFLGLSIISLPSNTINGKSAFNFFKEDLGINVGRYTQGKFPVMQFGLPAAAIGMTLAAPKENRKQVLKGFIPGILSSALLGITEPLEFSFLFVAPKLFYCFHAVLCGLSFMLMNICGTHIPSILSGGLIEMIILGVIPVAKGTHFYWYFAVGMILAPLYLGGFYLAVTRFNLKTPGREEGAHSHDEQATEEHTSKVPEQTRKLAIALGGWDNIEKLSNCASRLRYDIADKSKVNEAGLKAAGAIASKWVGDNHLQIIVGPKAESINNEMLKWKGEDLGI
ncbi:PTS system glucoside-specific EIICBA component [Candidatus Mycoplasma haematohominis]|uniref:PTS system glucoside-specific EIICBA component n=1 Tax=Candidatus Mycoplasma haematohominis TaxID=1494318 RepID=A0A478FP64_9MOLU|nr:PTS system glucoside-specific EIICBA component [Candidatus Mycoplasma haemohominis]